MSFEKQTFTGAQPEVSAEEQLEVVRLFSTCVDDTMVNNSDHVSVHEYRYGEYSNLLAMSTELNGQRFDLRLDKAHGSEGNERIISVTEVDDEDRGQNHYEYYLGESGVVIRSDHDLNVPSSTSKFRVFGEARATLSTEEKLGFIASLNDAAANRELEKQMGVNHQPVSKTEIDGLAKLVQSAKPGK